jgi:predicted aconitase
MQMIPLENLNNKLTREEQDLLAGGQGAMRRKIMQTVVRYGEALGAEKLVDITGPGHFVIAHAIPGISPSLGLLEDLVAEGLKTKQPFTLDPVAPLDFDNWWLAEAQIATLKQMYQDQPRYDTLMRKLGFLAPDGYTCTPYLPEVGNIPRRGDILAWSESACVVYANSVLGARSNRNAAILELLGNIIGKIPFTGLLTDAGRQATWRIEIRTEELPQPQILGAAIGTRVLADVPYIVGLDRFLGAELTPSVCDYLHEMGAASAAAGAVALYHVENLTPEAREHNTGLLSKNFKTHDITTKTLDEIRKSFPVLWPDRHAVPDKCFVGCPHLSFAQLAWWADHLLTRLNRQGTERIAIKTTLSAAPQVLERFRQEHGGWEKLLRAGVKFSPACPLQVFDNDLSKGDAIITNSTKLRTYTDARFFTDDEIVDIVVTGKIEEIA